MVVIPDDSNVQRGIQQDTECGRCVGCCRHRETRVLEDISEGFSLRTVSLEDEKMRHVMITITEE